MQKKNFAAFKERFHAGIIFGISDNPISNFLFGNIVFMTF